MQQQPKKKNNAKWLFPLLLAILLISFFMELYGSSCLISSISGFPCPACGSSRAVVLLLQGRVREALHMHPLIFLSLFLLIFISIYEIYKYMRRRKGLNVKVLFSPSVGRIILVFILLLYSGVYIVRMIKYFPHSEPMQYNWDSLWGRIARFIINVWNK